MSDELRVGGFRAALRHRDYRYLIAGLAVSESGNWLYSAASIVYILDATGSPAWVATAGVVRLLPYIFFEPLGGAIADRYDRRKVMIISDLARFLLMLVLTVVATSTSTTAVAISVGIAFLTNTFSAPYFPAVTAITPSIVGEEDLSSANALSGTIDNFAIAFGPALSVLLLWLGPPPVAFAVNAVTFLFSAYMVWRIQVRGKVGEVEIEATLRSRVTAGMQAIRGSRDALLLVGLTMAFAFTFGQEIVLFGPISEELLDMGLDATGVLFAAPGIGGILAAAAAARLASRQHTAAILTVSTLVAAIPITALSVMRAPAAAYLLLTIEGAAVIIADVVATTTLQRVVPREELGSVFGIVGALSVAAMALGSIVAPIAISALGLPGAAAFAGLTLVAVTSATLPRARAMDRVAASRAADLAPMVAILERLALLDGASPAQLEALAAVCTEEAVSAGTVVIREGDEPDDLFALESGTLEVTSTGTDRSIAPLGAGDHFGEIGLLQKSPRSATVTARSDVVLCRIPGEEFLRIANEGPRISARMMSVMANRLALTSSAEEMGHA